MRSSDRRTQRRERRAGTLGARRPTRARPSRSTAAARPDRSAIRTKGDEFSITWGEYAERVAGARRRAGGAGR